MSRYERITLAVATASLFINLPNAVLFLRWFFIDASTRDLLVLLSLVSLSLLMLAGTAVIFWLARPEDRSVPRPPRR